MLDRPFINSQFTPQMGALYNAALNVIFTSGQIVFSGSQEGAEYQVALYEGKRLDIESVMRRSVTDDPATLVTSLIQVADKAGVVLFQAAHSLKTHEDGREEIDAHVRVWRSGRWQEKLRRLAKKKRTPEPDAVVPEAGEADAVPIPDDDSDPNDVPNADQD